MRAALVAIGVVVALFVAVAALTVVLASWPHTSRSTVVVSTPAPLGVAAPEVRRIPLPARFDAAAIYAGRSPGVVTIYSVFAGQEEQGSGFVVSRDGVVLTNSHVVTSDGTRASAVAVRFADGDRIPATIVGYDVFDDVGVIRVDPKAHTLAPLPLGSSAAVRVGEPVAVIGSPFGNENSLTVGIVSATRSIPSLTSRFQLPDAIQTDAAVNHGNSGGPLFDAGGRVIGITAQIRSDTGAAEGVAFAVPIDAARRSLRELLDHGSVRYAYVGITSESLVPSVARRFGFGVARGAVITGIADDGPAAGAGFQAATRERTFAGGRAAADGDVVVAIDGLPVRSSDDLVRIVSERLRPGQLATFTVVRGRARKTIAVRLATRG
jgi:S1-C subfamily serine protease